MLTRHQELHLRAVLDDVIRHSSANVTVVVSEKLACAKRVDPQQWDEYLEEVKKQVQAILDSGEFPQLECASDIHDHLETNTVFNNKVTYG